MCTSPGRPCRDHESCARARVYRTNPKSVLNFGPVLFSRAAAGPTLGAAAAERTRDCSSDPCRARSRRDCRHRPECSAETASGSARRSVISMVARISWRGCLRACSLASVRSDRRQHGSCMRRRRVPPWPARATCRRAAHRRLRCATRSSRPWPGRALGLTSVFRRRSSLHPCIHPPVCMHPFLLGTHPRLQSCLRLHIHPCLRLPPGVGQHDAPAGDAGAPLSGAWPPALGQP